MARIPALSGQEIIKVLKQIGYRAIRKRGSHFRLLCPGRKSVTVPDYPIVSKGLLRKILRDADLTPEEFIKQL